jgi:7-keto-8-aminopelargonate synthetase-like enzyme
MKSVTPLDGPYVQFCGKKMLDFSSHDFLGLAQHPEVKKNAIKYTLRYGVGTPPHFLASAPQQQLEEKLAHFLGFEAVTFYPCYEGAKAAVLELKATIVSSLAQKKSKDASLVCIDDSETFGVLGPRGMGLAAQQKGADLILGSFVRGGGNFGAYIGSSHTLKSKLAPSSALPPSVLGALDAALNFIPEMDSERQTLAQHATWLKKQLEENGWKAKDSLLPIVSLSFSTEEEAAKLVRFFEEEAIFVGAPDSKQIVFCLTALHTPDDLDQLGTALKKLSTTDLAVAMQSLTPTPRR